MGLVILRFSYSAACFNHSVEYREASRKLRVEAAAATAAAAAAAKQITSKRELQPRVEWCVLRTIEGGHFLALYSFPTD